MKWDVALVDGDNIAYGAAFHMEMKHHKVIFKDGEEKDFGRSRKTDIKKWLKESGEIKRGGVIRQTIHYKDVSHGYQAAKQMCQKIQKQTQCEEMRVYLTSTDKSNYRFKTATILPYKGQRKPRPKYLKEMREYLIENWAATIIFNKEADDKLGIEHMKYYDPDPETSSSILCSKDKDLRNIPGWNLNMNNDEIEYIPAEDCIRHFYYQILQGDNCDNIPGLKKWMKPRSCGPVKATKLLADLTTEDQLYQKVRATYMKLALTDEDREKFNERITEIGQLLWIQQEEDVIWTPPQVR